MAEPLAAPEPYVFLSYASRDGARVLALADRLEAAGIRVWVDRRDLVGGSSWDAGIVDAIGACAAFALVCSTASLASVNVQQEVRLAWEEQRPILPLLLEQVAIPRELRYSLVGRQWVELIDRPEEAWLPDVLRALAYLGIVAGQPDAARVSPPPARPTRSTGAAPASNLPLPLTSFVGRAQESAEIARLLTSTRLLSLLGSGGVGKTRLAGEVARSLRERFPDGVWLVPLASLTDPALVPQAIMLALEVRERPGQPLAQTLTEYLATRRLLLVLDNCEHLVQACATITEALLGACPQVSFLVTSREALTIPGETRYRVPSLSLPAAQTPVPFDRLLLYEAIRLFDERARAIVPDFAVTEGNAAAVAQICRRLDGIPLALELAAARLSVLTVEQLAGHLSNQLGLLAGGSRTAAPRHQTLRAAIDWSYELLSGPEQRLFQQLAVFAGGWTLEAAEAVCAQADIASVEIFDLLAHLVEKSLVGMERQKGEARFHLLETVRTYARERLEAGGDAGRARGRHAQYFLARAEEAEPRLTSAERDLWLERLDAEHDNLRAALAACLAGAGASATAVRLVGALWWFWRFRGYWREGFRQTESVLAAAAGLDVKPAGYGKALSISGRLAYLLGEFGVARARLEESLVSARAAGDQPTIAYTCHFLGMLALNQGDDATARRRCAEGVNLWRSIGDRWGLALALFGLGDATLSIDTAQARVLYEEDLALWRSLGDPWGMTFPFTSLGQIAFLEGDYAKARAYFEEGLSMRRQVGDRFQIATSLAAVGEAARLQGDYAAAATFLEECLSVAREVGRNHDIARALYNLARIAQHHDDTQKSRTYFAESLALRRDIGDRPGMAECLTGLAEITAASGAWRQAVRLQSAAEQLQEAAPAAVQSLDRAGIVGMLAAARDHLGEPAFTRAWAEGQAIPLEQAIAEAIAPALAQSSPASSA